MEEAEALGTKIAIMVAGEFKCFGTSQEIKENYGKGFYVELKLNIKNIKDDVEKEKGLEELRKPENYDKDFNNYDDMV